VARGDAAQADNGRAGTKIQDICAFDAMPDLIGRTFEGEPFTVSQTERDTFDNVTWVTRAYGGTDPSDFPSDILEGFHSLALLDAVAKLATPWRFDKITFGYNYGLDRVRFTAPIHIGDRVLSSFKITDVRKRGAGYLVLRHCELTVEGAAGPALVADWWSLIMPSVDNG
jgi:acyl dehydratase